MEKWGESLITSTKEVVFLVMFPCVLFIAPKVLNELW